jgi:hypothetical protein
MLTKENFILQTVSSLQLRVPPIKAIATTIGSLIQNMVNKFTGLVIQKLMLVFMASATERMIVATQVLKL